MPPSNLTFRATPERAYARQHHLPGDEATPTIAFHDVPTSGMYLANVPSGELGFSVKGDRKLLVGNGVRVDGNLIVDGAIIGGDGNTIVPIVDFGNLDHNILPSTTDTYSIGSNDRRWTSLVASTIDANDVDISGNLVVSGNTTFAVGFDRVDNDLVPISTDTYSIGRPNEIWTDIFVTNVETTMLETTTANASNIETITLNVTGTATVDTVNAQSINVITANVTHLVNASGDDYVETSLQAFGSNIVPASNVTYCLGSETNQWQHVYTATIQANEYTTQDGSPLDFPTDYGNIDQSMIPTSNVAFDIGSTTNRWDGIWTDTLTSRSIQTAEFLDLNGDPFIPEIDFSNIESNVEPIVTATYGLGTAAKRWTEVWASELYGNLNAESLYGNLSGDLTISGNIGLNGTATLQDGTESAPSLAFQNELGTGMYRPEANSIGFSVNGSTKLAISGDAVIASVIGDANTVYYGDATNMTFPADRLQVSQIQITDNTFTEIAQTAVEANTVGYVAIFGTSFEAGAMTVRYGQNLAPSVSVVSYAEIHASVPAIAAGTYDVTVTKNGSESATLPNSLNVSNIPSWTTDQDLGYIYANIAFERTVSATEGDSNIVYADIPGGSYPLPPNTTVSSNGLIEGNVTQDDVSTQTTYNFDILATDDQLQNTIRIFTLNYVPQYVSGDKSASSILQVSRTLLGPSETQTPASGAGTITVNSQYICPYDVTLRQGDFNVTSFVDSDWFTQTADSRCSFVKVFGNMNIPGGVTFRPSARKLFTVLHVTGDLTVDGIVSMTARGASHSAVTAAAIRVANGTYSGVTDPTIGASGNAGGTAATTTQTLEGTDGGSGYTGSTLKTGGGASGGAFTGDSSVTVVSGAGTSGTSFSGGTGGGGVYSIGSSSFTPTANSGVANGGIGGNAAISGLSGSSPGSAGGGAGNPGGGGRSVVTTESNLDGGDGTGGIMIVIVDGTLYGSGTIEARGSDGGTWNSSSGVSGGGASGGGIVVVMAKNNQSSITLDVSGGTGGLAYGNPLGPSFPGGRGGDGGDGSSIVLAV